MDFFFKKKTQPLKISETQDFHASPEHIKASSYCFGSLLDRSLIPYEPETRDTKKGAAFTVAKQKLIGSASRQRKKRSFICIPPTTPVGNLAPALRTPETAAPHKRGMRSTIQGLRRAIWLTSRSGAGFASETHRTQATSKSLPPPLWSNPLLTPSVARLTTPFPTFLPLRSLDLFQAFRTLSIHLVSKRILGESLQEPRGSINAVPAQSRAVKKQLISNWVRKRGGKSWRGLPTLVPKVRARFCTNTRRLQAPGCPAELTDREKGEAAFASNT